MRATVHAALCLQLGFALATLGLENWMITAFLLKNAWMDSRLINSQTCLAKGARKSSDIEPALPKVE